ncbi:MAG: hypothetical protein ACRDWT_10775 [Jatrophihabitantaceae bacterium]
MSKHERTPCRGVRRLAALGALGLAATFLTVTGVGPAQASGSATVHIDTTGRIGTGQTIQVSGNAGATGSNIPDLYVAVCEGTPTASNCDQSLSGFGTATAHIQQVTPDPSTGAWSTSFFVRTTIVTGNTPGGYNCMTAGTCIIGTTNSANPADHTYDATTPLANLGPAITLSSSTGVDGNTVAVSGSGFPVANTSTGAAISQAVNIGLCGFPPTATSCDGNLAHYAPATVSNGQLPSTNVTLHFPFTDFGSAAHTCTAANQCIVGTSNATNQADQSFTAGALVQNVPAATLHIGSVTGQSVTTAARAGDTVNLTGVNWDSSGAITAQLCDTSGATCDASGLTGSTLAADGSGNLTGGVSVDASATTGARSIEVSQGAHVVSANISILGTPTLSGSPASGGTGTSVNITGANWNPGSTVTLQGTTVSGNSSDPAVTVTASGTGAISGSYLVNDASTSSILAFSGALSASQAFSFTSNDCTVPTAGSCSVQQNVTFKANPGVLEQSQGGGSIDLGSLTLNGQDQNLTGAINTDTVTDARGTSAGWLLNARLTDLTNGGTGANDTISASNMGWAPVCAKTSGGATPAAGSPGTLSNSDQLFCSVPTGTGNGIYTADSALNLLVPATADAGTYNAILTLTLS